MVASGQESVRDYAKMSKHTLSRNRLLLALALMLEAVAASGTELNCQATRKPLETVICSRQDIISAKRRLDANWRKVMQINSPGEKQRFVRWRDDQNDICSLPANGTINAEEIAASQDCVLKAINGQADQLQYAMKLPTAIPGLTSAKDSACRTDPNVIGACRIVHGYLHFFNGDGGQSVLDLDVNKGYSLDGQSPYPKSLEKILDKYHFNVDLFGKFEICPLSWQDRFERPTFCVESVTDITKRPFEP